MDTKYAMILIIIEIFIWLFFSIHTITDLVIGLYTAFNFSTNMLHDVWNVLHVNTIEFLLMIKWCKNDKSRFVNIQYLLVIIYLLLIYLSCRGYLFGVCSVCGLYCITRVEWTTLTFLSMLLPPKTTLTKVTFLKFLFKNDLSVP